MADIELVIKIPEEKYKEIMTYKEGYLKLGYFETIIANGTPIPDNATNGEVIKAMFGVKEVDMSNTYCVHFPEEEDYSHYFFKEWWNALYRKGGKG